MSILRARAARTTSSWSDVTSTTELQHRCVRALEAVFPVPPSSLGAACRRLEEVRGRPIRIRITDPGTLRVPAGLWIHAADAETVWADSRTSQMHQLVIIGHELGHMICGHRPPPLPPRAPTSPAGVSAQTAELVDGAARGVLGRCGEPVPAGQTLQREIEEEAEFTGRLLVRPFLRAHDVELAALLEGHR